MTYITIGLDENHGKKCNNHGRLLVAKFTAIHGNNSRTLVV